MNAESIGEKLKKIRQSKGLSLEDVHKKTKIHLNILKAIEGESLTNLSPIYLKGFLKIYCRSLGVDSKECVPDYKEPQAAFSGSNSLEPKDQPLKSPSFLENVSLKLSFWQPGKKIKKIIIPIFIIAVVGIILLKLGQFIASRPRISPAVAHNQQVRLQARPKVKAPNITPSTPKLQVFAAKLPKETTGGISLVISAKENCLVFVKVDGRVVLHRVLERGRSDSWKAKERIELSLGNAAAVELIVNGERFANLGRRGQQLKNIIITEKDGLRIPR
ncbi:MAG: DUF4115 domain-containing protein [Candidatus Omnitrophota bacterium]|nr:DUF4115 domain-containing protein [Candidatus Omnitrophota bacterium]